MSETADTSGEMPERKRTRLDPPYESNRGGWSAFDVWWTRIRWTPDHEAALKTRQALDLDRAPEA